MKLNLQLSCYNGARYLPFLFASLQKQTLKDWHLYVLDNASDEENERLIKQAVEQSGLPITLYRVNPNIGFAGAHNFLFEKHKENSDAVQLLNDDAILEPEYLEKCLAYLGSHPNCASVSGQIFRWNFDEKDGPSRGKTNTIDSLGLEFDWKGFFTDRGVGAHGMRPVRPNERLNDERQSDRRPTTDRRAQALRPYGKTPIIGVSGCLPMYRVSAVRAVAMEDTLFDPSYRIYKEDCDVALRFKAAGYTAAIVNDAVAYHRRNLGMKSFSAKSFARAINENTICSYRNHLWLLIAHLTPLSLVTSRIGVIPAEIAKAIYWTIRSPKVTLSVIRDTKIEWPHLMKKREFIQHLRQDGERHRDTKRPQAPTCEIAIIMVSHGDLSEECLQSLQVARAQTRHSTAVVVVDNLSTNYRANEFVERIVPDAWTILRNDDHGYGRSMNVGAKHVQAKYYFILNPDTVLADPNLFNVLFDYMETHQDVGLVGPRINNFQGELQDTCRRFPSWYQPLIQRTSLKKTNFGQTYLKQFLMRDIDHNVEQPVDWAQGSAMFIGGDLWKKLGGFDDRFWLYFEDIDLCRRVWKSGKKVIYLPSVIIQHAHGRQSAQIQNFIVNFIKVKETRGHIASWIKYMWKWRVIPVKTGIQYVGRHTGSPPTRG